MVKPNHHRLSPLVIKKCIILSIQFNLINRIFSTAYSGTAPGDNMIGYNAFIMETSVANAAQYLVSVYISAEENLYLILVITILAVPLFTIADIHYGSGTSRNICGKKKPVVVANKHTELVISSSKEKGGTLRVLLHLCVVCQPLISLSCTPAFDITILHIQRPFSIQDMSI